MSGTSRALAAAEWLANLPGGRLARLLLGVLALLGTLHLANELGTRVAGISAPSVSVEWWILFIAGGLLLLPARVGPVNVGRLALIATLLAATYLPLSTAFETIARPSAHTFSVFRPSSGERVVEKVVVIDGLRVASRRELNRITGRRRDVGLELDGFVTAPSTGTYELSYVCDDDCSVSIGSQTLELLLGVGMVALQLDEGTYPLTIRYRQVAGPSSFVLGWNRPGVLELFPMDRFVGNEREAIAPRALRGEHRRAVLLLVLGSAWAFLFLALLVRLGEQLWSNSKYAVAFVVAANVAFLVAVIGWTPSASWFWLGTAVLVLAVSWIRIAKTLGSPPPRVRLAAVVLTGLLFTVLANYHVGIVNGPWYWKWDWRRLAPVELFATMGLALVPFIVAQLIWYRRRSRTLGISLVLMMVTTIGFQIGARTIKTSLVKDGIVFRIVNANITSYFTDARSVTSIREWLGAVPERMHDYHLHSRNKPPGNVLYFTVFRKLFDDPRDAAYASGLVLILLASLSIPLTYWLARALSASDDVAFASASLIALAPGLSFHSPGPDQLSPSLGCMLVGTWALALRSNRSRRYAVAYGLSLTLVLFMNYTLLVLGLFLGGYTVLHVLGAPRDRLHPAAVAVLTSLATVIATYTVLWVTTGYDPVGTFATAVRLQAGLLARTLRPYPATVWYDPADFVLGVGWVSVMLAAIYVAVTMRRRNALEAPEPSGLAVGGLVVAQVVVLSVTALIPGENSRVWLFLYPLVTLVGAFELSRWRPRAAMLAYAAQFLVFVTLYQNMAMGQ